MTGGRVVWSLQVLKLSSKHDEKGGAFVNVKECVMKFITKFASSWDFVVLLVA